MCYHISFEVKLESILDIFPDLVVDPQLEAEFPTSAFVDGFDHKPHPVMVKSRKDSQRHLANMVWGFLPDSVRNYDEADKFWNGYKDEQGKWHEGFVTLDAVGEELFDKVLYKEAALKTRCVIFIDGFYEWQHVHPVGKKGQVLKTTAKYPYHIFLPGNAKSVTMLAGIWRVWKHYEIDKETGELKTIFTPTFAMCTTKANSKIARIHNRKERMPTILTKELAEEWLQDGLTQKRITEIASNQYREELMDAYTIPKDFKVTGLAKTKCYYPELENAVLYNLNNNLNEYNN